MTPSSIQASDRYRTLCLCPRRQKVAATQLWEYLCSNGLNEELQSACKANHSCETALIRVQDDILKAIDSHRGDIVREHGLSFHFYADDSRLYTSFDCNDTSDLVAAKQRLENCVADNNLWMTASKLKLNNDTSEFLFLHSRFRHSLPPPTISVGMENIRPSQQARNLGVIVDDTMSLSRHVNTIVKGAFYHIRNISKMGKYISKSTTEIIIHSFVSSKLDFCISLLFGAQKRDIARLQSVQNAAARIIAGLKKLDHMTETQRDLYCCLPVEERIIFKIKLITFKTLNGSGPRYLEDILNFYHQSKTLRSSIQGIIYALKNQILT